MQAIFTTRNDAIQALIINPLIMSGQNTNDYDIEAIANETIIEFTTPTNHIYYIQAHDYDTDWYWEIVEDHSITD